jgi:hypothetical protein
MFLFLRVANLDPAVIAISAQIVDQNKIKSGREISAAFD